MQDSLQDMEVFGQEEWAALPSGKIKVPHPQLPQKHLKLSLMLKEAIYSIKNYG